MEADASIWEPLIVRAQSTELERDNQMRLPRPLLRVVKVVAEKILGNAGACVIAFRWQIPVSGNGLVDPM
jgi:hypothetical protein